MRPAAAATSSASAAYVVDGDTVDLTNGAGVRLVQVDTPEVYALPECYGEQASAAAGRLPPRGTRVRLYREPRTDAVDRYGRLLRYVVRARILVGDRLMFTTDSSYPVLTQGYGTTVAMAGGSRLAQFVALEGHDR